MRIRDYNPSGLCDTDRAIFNNALELSKDCNKWQWLEYLSSMAQNIELVCLLRDTSRKMFHTLDYYSDHME
jgi:hypothetical protein